MSHEFQKRIALITGINGMDGSHLADLLLKKNYEVHGIIRRHSVNDSILKNINHIKDSITLHIADMTDAASLNDVISIVKPNEVYNLAAQSFVGSSWNLPKQTVEVNGIGTLNLLEAVRNWHPTARVYQASTSEMFGKQTVKYASENTRFYPRSPYGVSKLYAHWTCINYRESYDMYISCGILFNHESERRGIEFVTQKIATGVAKIFLGLEDYIELGNLNARRDWGYAPEYVEAMWKMLQQDLPDDFVIGTGESHSVNDFLVSAFQCIGVDEKDISNYVKQNPALMRPADVDYLCADSSKAKEVLNWSPTISFNEIVSRMVKNQIELMS